MKNVTLITVLLVCLTLSSQAQTNSQLTGNQPNSTKTGYQFDFNGTAPENCPSQIPSQDYGISSNYTINSIGGGTMTVTTSGNQTSDERLNLKLTEGDCSPITINLSALANQKIVIKLHSSVAVPQLMIQLSDASGNFMSNMPPVQALVVGDNVLTFNTLDFSRYGTTARVDSTRIQHVSLFFRKSYNDNQGGASPSIAGTFIVDYIRIGDVSQLVTASKPAAVESSLEYYPNPFTDQLNVKFNYNRNSKVVLNDMSGVEVRSEVVVAGTNITSIDTRNLKSGIYLLSILTDEGVVSKKVVLGK